MRKTLLILFLLTSFVCLSQKKKQNPPLTIRGNIGIPKIISSKRFKTAFSSVVEGNISINRRLFDNFFIGVGYDYCSFQNNKKEWSAQVVTPQGSVYYKTNLMGHSGFIKVGYDNFFSDIGYGSFSLNAGYMSMNYTGIFPDSSDANKPFISTRFAAPYVQPEVAVHFLADKLVSFSIFLGYTTVFTKFNAKAPRFNAIGAVVEARNNYVMSWINIGFGFNILIPSKK